MSSTEKNGEDQQVEDPTSRSRMDHSDNEDPSDQSRAADDDTGIYTDLIPDTDPDTGQMLIDDVEPSQFDLPWESARKYLAYISVENTEGTVESKKYRVKRYHEFLEHISLGHPIEARLKDVDRFFAYLGKNERRALNTLTGYRTVLYQYYEFMHDFDHFETPEISCHDIKKFDCSKYCEKEKAYERSSITREEIDMLYDAANTKQKELLLRVIYEMGLRNSDVRRLKIDNIDFEAKLITVENRKNGKTDDIPVREDLLLRIDDFIKTERKTYKGSESHRYLFCSPKGGGLKGQYVTKKVKELAGEDNADIQEVIGNSLARKFQESEYQDFYRVTPHTLRHAIVTHLAENDLSNDMISYLTGHESDAIEDYKDLDAERAHGLIRENIR